MVENQKLEVTFYYIGNMIQTHNLMVATMSTFQMSYRFISVDIQNKINLNERKSVRYSFLSVPFVLYSH